MTRSIWITKRPDFFGVIAIIVFSIFLNLAPAAEPEAHLYTNNFDAAALDTLPEDFFLLDGAFAVKAEGGNQFLELPGAPLSTYGLLFGPKVNEGIGVSARIWSAGQGRKFSTFGVGLNGAGGFRLQVTPAKKLLELHLGDTLLTTVPYAWESGAWTRLRLQVRRVKDGEWSVQGKAWKDGTAEPEKWMIAHELVKEPFAGQPSLWGNPFAGTPIRYDDLEVVKAR